MGIKERVTLPPAGELELSRPKHLARESARERFAEELYVHAPLQLSYRMYQWGLEAETEDDMCCLATKWAQQRGCDVEWVTSRLSRGAWNVMIGEPVWDTRRPWTSWNEMARPLLSPDEESGVRWDESWIRFGIRGWDPGMESPGQARTTRLAALTRQLDEYLAAVVAGVKETPLPYPIREVVFVWLVQRVACKASWASISRGAGLSTWKHIRSECQDAAAYLGLPLSSGRADGKPHGAPSKKPKLR